MGPVPQAEASDGGLGSALTRRSLLRFAGGAVTLWVTPAPAMARLLDPASGGPADAPSWMGPPGEARFRIDGLPKVLGEKIFARDFRARDMDGWPERERGALVLRATNADRPLVGYDLSSLPEHLQPLREVTAATLDADHVSDLPYDASPEGRPTGLFVEAGKAAVYFGQPVAILVFANGETLRQAARRLQFRDDVVQYGPPVEQTPLTTPYSPPTYLTRYAVGEERFSQTKDGPSDPYATGTSRTAVDEEAARWRRVIEREMRDEGWRVFESRATTQTIVPMFMEPENGLGWLDRDSGTLHIVVGTQSPFGDVADAAAMFQNAACPIKIAAVRLTSCYPGGGFGGRDTSPLTPLLMLAAAYSDGPVRLAYDRFAEFQGGLTQLRSVIEQELAVDGEGRFQALRSSITMPSGGKNNYSQYVAELAGYTAGGGYRLPRVSVDAVAMPTPGLVAGSMRGFGGPQAAFALETLVDRVAVDLGVDAIELRRRNALTDADRTITGAPLYEPMRIVEICDRALENPLWTDRPPRESPGRERYGVGFALANQAYGTGNDGVMAAVTLDEDGALAVTTNAVDMGNGSATTLALSTARWLGANASEIRMGRVDLFDHLELSSSVSDRGRTTSRPLWSYPHYTKSVSMSSSACITAFQQVHAVEAASRALFRLGVVPAAASLWGETPGKDAWPSSAWRDGHLHLGGLPPLPWSDLAAEIFRLGLVAETLVHAYFAGRWIWATYRIGDDSFEWPIDGLATREAGKATYDWHPRSHTIPPPLHADRFGRSLYAPSATLCAVTVDVETGVVRPRAFHTYLDAGKTLQPDLLSGQYEGAVAMGTGYALLEFLPPGAGGGGDGTWNLDRYHVPLAADLPLDAIELELLPPLGQDPTGKGIAEAVLCPIAPAIANAVYDAVGVRFDTLPITPERVRTALSENGMRETTS